MNCPICNVVQMEYCGEVPSNKPYKIKRFVCTVCNCQQTKWGGSSLDTAEEKQYQKQINEMKNETDSI